MSRRKSSRREEESESVGEKGGRKGGREEGQWREIQRERGREMMGVIRIKTVGFGQSRVRAAASMPTPHPPRLSRAKLQPKSVALAHAGSLHDTQADSTWLCREHPKHTPNTHTGRLVLYKVSGLL